MSKKKTCLFIGILIVPVVAVVAFLVLTLVFGGQKKEEKMYSEPKKVAPYLYEITYKDYREDTERETLSNSQAFGCSSVRNGNFYGRNFDFVFNDVPEFVIKVEANSNRHASLGIATHLGLREANLENGEYDKQLELIPNFTLDGINDAGVIISDNVVSQYDTAELTGTNPGAERLHIGLVPRYILDNANSADNAVELLKNRDLYGDAAGGMYLHFMIADKDKTYVAEIIDNKLVVEEKTGDKQIMTNFYVNRKELNEHASGVERYAILQENYDQGKTFDGMRALMKRVRYSNAYRYSNNPVWYSEVFAQKALKDQNSDAFKATVEDLKYVLADYWNAILGDKRDLENPMFWHTTHNSIYDMSKKMLRVTVQEDYAHYFDYYL